MNRFRKKTKPDGTFGRSTQTSIRSTGEVDAPLEIERASSTASKGSMVSTASRLRSRLGKSLKKVSSVSSFRRGKASHNPHSTNGPDVPLSEAEIFARDSAGVGDGDAGDAAASRSHEPLPALSQSLFTVDQALQKRILSHAAFQSSASSVVLVDQPEAETTEAKVTPVSPRSQGVASPVLQSILKRSTPPSVTVAQTKDESVSTKSQPTSEVRTRDRPSSSIPAPSDSSPSVYPETAYEASVVVMDVPAKPSESDDRIMAPSTFKPSAGPEAVSSEHGKTAGVDAGLVNVDVARPDVSDPTPSHPMPVTLQPGPTRAREEVDRTPSSISSSTDQRPSPSRRKKPRSDRSKQPTIDEPASTKEEKEMLEISSTQAISTAPPTTSDPELPTSKPKPAPSSNRAEGERPPDNPPASQDKAMSNEIHPISSPDATLATERPEPRRRSSSSSKAAAANSKRTSSGQSTAPPAFRDVFKTCIALSLGLCLVYLVLVTELEGLRIYILSCIALLLLL